MDAASPTKSGRDLVAYFAGHLANLINGNDRLADDVEIVEIQAFQLYERVRHVLVSNRRYSEALLGVWAYPPPNDVEDAADFYFDSVLDRPIGRRGDAPSSSDNLRSLIAAKAVGPFVHANQPDLSTWKALVGGPPRFRRFIEKRELFELSNRILKCLDAANRGYAEVLRLGLCPKEWLVGESVVPLNSLKAANSFLKALKTEMKRDLGRRPTAGELEQAWAIAPVPGHSSANAFAGSLFGSSILSRIAGQDHTALVPYGDVEAWLEGQEAEPEAPLMTADEATPILDRAVAAGVLEADEMRLLAGIINGRPLAEAMRSDLGLRRRLKTQFGNDLDAYVEDLSARVAAFASGPGNIRP
jgi:hypothetical protein